MGMFINVDGAQYEHVVGLLSDEGAVFHPVGGTEVEVDPASWDGLAADVRYEIARFALPGSDIVAAPSQVGGEAPALSDEDAGVDEAAPRADAGEQGAGSSRPPLTGRGSGRDAWATYARDIGVRVTPDMKREDIINAVERVEE